uniref:Reverse transcriptase domain-containing protein n=1 Tax=Peronospora matthiolae TaxID=2874970 RepID=A0AAV1VEX9_9STRA
MTMDPFLDQTSPGSSFHDAGRSELFDWMISLGLIDFWRLENPEMLEFTGPKSKNRIDYCLASIDFYDKFIRSSSHLLGTKFGGADHVPVEFSASSHQPPPHDSLPFKCPPWLLKCAHVQDHLHRGLMRLATALDPSRNPGCLLDEHKRRDRIFLSQEYLRRKNATACQLRQLLTTSRDCEKLFAMDPTDYNRLQRDQSRQDYMDFSTALRERNAASKFDLDVNSSERSSKHFFRAPAAADLRLSISSVDTSSGLSRDPSTILLTHRQYWGTVFQSDSRDLGVEPQLFDSSKLQDILCHSLRKLKSSQASMLDAPITANDFFFAIKHTARGKSPGPDGLPAEYYQLFPTAWAQVLELVYAAQFRMGRMSKFQRRAYISLLFKKGSRSDPKHYRPLTLLNQDAKFGPKALAYRLNQVLPSLLNVDQFGFVPGRDIRHALRYFQDLQDHCRRANSHVPAGAICLDFAKAFDSVNWQALDQVLQHWGFGWNFRHWVKTFFRGTLVQVLINSSRSDFFSLGAGVRQGDPLSPGLFVLFIEPLLCYLRATTTCSAIKIRNTSHQLVSFADDVTGLVNNLSHAPMFLDRVQDFCAATGMRLNVDKTVLFPFRPWTSSDIILQDRLRALGVRILGNAEHTTLLGIAVGPAVTPQLQLSQLLLRFQKLCISWRWRARTLRGRVLLLKTMVLSTLWHFLGTVAVSKQDLLKFNPLMRNFINCTPSSAVHDPATRGQFPSVWHPVDASSGGLDLPSVATSVELLQVNLLRQLIRRCRQDFSSSPKWFIPAQAAIDSAFCGQGSGLDFLYVHLSPSAQSSRWQAVPAYWRAAIATWSTKIILKLQCANPVLTKLTWPLWNNVFLRFTEDKRTLAVLHRKACNFLSHQGVTRTSTFRSVFGWLPDEATLRDSLSSSSIKPGRSLTSVVNKLAPRLALPAHYQDFAIFPLPPESRVAALHVWTFDGVDIVNVSNRVVKKLLLNHDPPPLPLLQLSAPDVVVDSSHWALERVLQRDVLPVFSDFVFRLQHNGLGFRYKYKWHTGEVTCVHGCATSETPLHLLWDCYMAKRLWHLFLPMFSRLFQSDIGWPQVLFLHNLVVPAHHTLIFGSLLPVRLFNVVRSVLLRTLWLNRNKAIFDPPALQFMGVFRQCLTLVRLHLQRLFKTMTHSRKKDSTLHKSQLLAFSDEWYRDFAEDPFYLLAG